MTPSPPAPFCTGAAPGPRAMPLADGACGGWAPLAGGPLADTGAPPCTAPPPAWCGFSTMPADGQWQAGGGGAVGHCACRIVRHATPPAGRWPAARWDTGVVKRAWTSHVSATRLPLGLGAAAQAARGAAREAGLAARIPMISCSCGPCVAMLAAQSSHEPARQVPACDKYTTLNTSAAPRPAAGSCAGLLPQSAAPLPLITTQAQRRHNHVIGRG